MFLEQSKELQRTFLTAMACSDTDILDIGPLLPEMEGHCC